MTALTESRILGNDLNMGIPRALKGKEAKKVDTDI